jgi:uncharacterized protein (TIGR03083 family)
VTTSPRFPTDRAVAAIERETARVVEIARSGDRAVPVATCGTWTLADLTWHLAEVQDFWAWIVGERAQAPDAYPEPVRPADDALADALEGNAARLVRTLRDSDPASVCWSWAAEQTVGFTMRRQAHEALIHRVDAELAVDARSDIDAELAADGVDELISVFLAEVPDWASFRASDDAVEVTLAGVASAGWRCRFGRMTGTSPASGRTYDLDAVELDDAAPVGAQLRGHADDLDLWLWGRAPIDRLDVVGDMDLVHRLRALVVESTQ